MTIDMFDSAYNDQFPPNPQAVAAYVDGALGDQPNYAYIVREFPAAHHLSIALYPEHDADALDVETGAARPQDIPGWFARQRQRGVHRPCVYASVSTMEAYVVPLMRASAILRASVRLWSAHYLAGEHICGPATCRLVSIGMDGTQWDDAALGRSLDQSLLLPDFFGTPALTWTEFDMSKLRVLKQGDTGQAVRNWQGILASHGYGYMIAPAVVTPDMTVEEKAGIDGDFGVKTDAATRRLQEDLQVTGGPDGEVGQYTYERTLSVP